MPGPTLLSVPPQPTGQGIQPPSMSMLPGMPPAGWRFIKRYLINPAALDTSSLGDVLMPPGFAHAMIIWRARDTSANNFASFGNMQMATATQVIDTGNNYDWVDTAVNSSVPVTALNSGNLVNGIDAFTTAGGATVAQVWNEGTIWFPFYSFADKKPYCMWSSITDNITSGQGIVQRSGAGDYRFQGALTKVRFISNAGNLAANSYFDLYCG